MKRPPATAPLAVEMAVLPLSRQPPVLGRPRPPSTSSTSAMPDPDRYKLLHGPYRPPKVRRGDKLFCEVRGTVTVGGYSDAPIPWPRVKKGGLPCLILCGDLVRAVREESEVAVAHHFGVSVTTVWAWRKVLGVEAYSEGTRRLQGRQALARPEHLEAIRPLSFTPEAVEKRAAPRRGKPVPLTPAQRQRQKAGARRSHTAEWREKVSAKLKQMGHRPINPDVRYWTAEEDALLGTATDREVAERLDGRSTSAVAGRRITLGVEAFGRR